METTTTTHAPEPRSVVARDRDGSELSRRTESPLERAQHVHGPAQQRSWRVHPPCHNPPASSGVATLSFEDGSWWCFRCEVAWLPDPESDRLSGAMDHQVDSRPCPDHGGQLAPMATRDWCPTGKHYV
jgi:hypothetical protein